MKIFLFSSHLNLIIESVGRWVGGSVIGGLVGLWVDKLVVGSRLVNGGRVGG